ncbi:MAG: hypothetical protein MJZ75_03080 [Paludibacteraceae bacterium]|nr:hypothetical protein [Paludibacteraceae bacterium]
MKTNISILGIGGAGRNVVNQLCKQNPELNCFHYCEGEPEENIDNALNGAKVLILVAGLGGHISSFVSIDVAKKAKEAGIKTIAVVTTPFTFEGSIRIGKATHAVSELKELTDELHICDNESLRTKYADLAIVNAFSKSHDEVISIILSIVKNL